MQLVLHGKGGRPRSLWFDGQVELPRQPPFPAVLVDRKPACFVTVSLDHDRPKLRDELRLFEAWYAQRAVLRVTVAADKACFAAQMRCEGMEMDVGIQSLVSVLPPVRYAYNETLGRRLPYTATPTWQPVAKPAYRYVLTALRYEWAPPPGLATAQQMGLVN